MALTSVTKSPKISEVSVALTWDGWGSESTPKRRVGIGLVGEQFGVSGLLFLGDRGRVGVLKGVMLQVIWAVCAISSGTLIDMMKLEFRAGVRGVTGGGFDAKEQQYSQWLQRLY